jgi:hypothetical protein
MTIPSTPRPLTPRLPALVLLLIPVLLAGCASGPRSDEGAVYLVVENRRPETVTIYAVRHSSRFRLGTVSGIAREEFVIRSHMLGPGGELQLAIDPLGDPNRRFTRVVHVSEGETVRLQLIF